jgi:signal transduction histidine kinase
LGFNERIEAIYAVAEAVFRETTLPELLREALEASIRVAGAQAGTIALFDAEKKKLVFRHVVGEKAGSLIGYELDSAEGVLGQVFRSGEPEITKDAESAPQHTRRVDTESGYRTLDMVTVPLKTMTGEAVGAMQILNKESGEFRQGDLQLATILGSLIAASIENARLHEEAKAAEIAHLIGDVSHDVKNMMTPISTSAETLRLMLDDMFASLTKIDQGPIVEATSDVREFYGEAFDMLSENALAVQARVKEISDAVKGAITKPNFEFLDPADTAEKVVATLRRLAQTKGLSLDLQRDSGNAVARIDRSRVYNAVYNLVNNAIPETPEGGSITVRTFLADSGSTFGIEVADTGRGIPDEILAKLFTDEAVSTKPGGTGLGTRIVKKAVDAHGGRVEVDSRPGSGSTFTIFLPIDGPPQEPSRTTARLPHARD